MDQNELLKEIDMDAGLQDQSKQTIVKKIGKYILFKILQIFIERSLVKKKRETEVHGIPEDIDCQLLKKVWNKIYNCACTVKKDTKTNEEYLTLRGDHRQEIYDFLIEEGIGIKENITIHGGDI